MRTRLLIGTALALLVVGILLLDGHLAAQVPPTWPVFGLDLGDWLRNGSLCTALIVVLTLLTVHELVHLARVRGYRPFAGTAQFFAAALVIGPYVSYNLSPVTGGYDESWGLLWLALALAFMFLRQSARYRTQNAMENLAITIFIIFYTGGLAGFMTKLRMEVGGQTGVTLLLFSMFIVKITDTGAYFVGRAFGRHKLVEWLSPKKTWEGFFGGLATAVLCAVLLGNWLIGAGWLQFERRLLPSSAALAFLGLLLGLVSVAGDLAASLLKRDAAVKDSGHVFPGLGGVLDVVDSPLLAAPIIWLFWTRLCVVHG